jgi:hypothetical protein
VRYRDATANSFVAQVWGEVFAHFHAVGVKKVKVICGTDCLVCKDELFVSNPLEVRENNKHVLYFVIDVSRLFRSRLFWTFHTKRRYTPHDLSLERLFIHCQGLCCTFPDICTKVYAVPLFESS